MSVFMIPLTKCGLFSHFLVYFCHSSYFSEKYRLKYLQPNAPQSWKEIFTMFLSLLHVSKSVLFHLLNICFSRYKIFVDSWCNKYYIFEISTLSDWMNENVQTSTVEVVNYFQKAIWSRWHSSRTVVQWVAQNCAHILQKVT